ILVGALMSVATATTLHAACNVIPGTEKSFSATLGATNRPFSAPGENVELRLRGCDASPGFLLAGSDHVVTLVFKSSSGDIRVVAIAGNCGGVDLAACSGAPGVVSTTC